MNEFNMQIKMHVHV